jgi:hypothetical protein
VSCAKNGEYGDKAISRVSAFYVIRQLLKVMLIVAGRDIHHSNFHAPLPNKSPIL